MVFPTLSVTIIGLIAGLAALSFGRERSWRSVVRGLLGAWAGFAVGGLAGAAIDVVLRSGELVALLGHAGAVALAYLAVTRKPGRPERAVAAREGGM